MRRARKSFGFGKKFGVAKGPLKGSRQGIRAGGSGVLAIRHKGPKSTRKGALRFFSELGGTGQKNGLRGKR